ncbi:hypothetical protein NQ317_011926 [Molorchus minor]|uniref:Lysosomal-associated transmembrane protein 4B n=1 Tax=Molorchus minor TaxID=1323400 RepID=A0ABQ9JDB9_9CUCU|nr:hypothetical protein NQ317_011926 [Molorchus minor]
MLSMRLKLGLIRNNEWKCCSCLHVRTATIAFGIWHLILHILALTVLALIMRNHHVVQKHEFQQNDFLPTPLTDIDMGALMTVCTLSITLLMVYGTIKGKATHLLPFFCLQLFDFAITLLTATGYFCYLRSVQRLIAEHWNLPFRHELLQLNPRVLSLLVFTAFALSILWKAYWISVIWRCYKYLTLRQQTMRNTINYILPEGSDRINDPDYPSFFHDTEGGYGSALKQTPPPSYQDIMEDQPPPYPATLQSELGEEQPNRFRFMFYPDPTTSGIHSNAPNSDEGTALNASVSQVESNVEVATTSNNVNLESESIGNEVNAENVAGVKEQTETTLTNGESDTTDVNNDQDDAGARALSVDAADANTIIPNNSKM